VLQVWFYLTPIIYSIDSVPAKYHFFFKLNPVIYALNEFRLSVYYGLLPTAGSFLGAFVCGFVALYLGFWMFRKHQDDFVFYV
jgi:lipopolysaccharide transport system permease protein